MPSPARRSKQDPRRERLGALALQITLRAGVTADAKKEAPSEFRIFRAGVNPSEKGDFLFDEISAASVMAAYAAYGKPLAIDYNHGTSFPFPSPEDAKAAGWFTPAVRDGELWATAIDWTTAGAEYVASGEYGLFSPWFEHDGSDPARVTRLINCALTNLPALNHIDQLVAANANTETPMECAACTALNARLAKMEEECTALRSRLAAYDKDADEMKASASLRATVVALTGISDTAGAIGALQAIKRGADEAVALRAAAEQETAARQTAEFNALVDECVTKVFVTPAQKEAFRTEHAPGGKITAASLSGVRGFMKFARPQLPTERQHTPPGDHLELSPGAKEMAAKLGIDPASFAKHQAAKLTGVA